MKTSTEKAHAKYSASGSSRWLSCPGSIRLSEKAPPQLDSPYAKEGTDAHLVLELLMKEYTKKGGRPRVLAQELLKKYPKEMLTHAREAIQAISEKYNYFGATWVCETRVDASGFTMPGQFGTADCAIVEEFGTLTVIDYKYGAGVPVDVENNSQLIYYALGVAIKYDMNFNQVRLVVIQPRADHKDGPIREQLMTIDELAAWIPIFKAGVKAAEKKDAPLKYGEKWCRWCPAASICPEISSQAFKTAQIDFDVVEPTKEIVLPKPEGVKIQHLGRLLDAADKLDHWIGALRSQAYNTLYRGGKVSGYKLIAKRSTRKWSDVASAEKEARKKFGTKALTSPVLLSPAQLEKLAGKAWVNERTSNLSSGFTLATASHKSPAVNPVAEEFSVVDEDADNEVPISRKPKRISKGKN